MTTLFQKIAVRRVFLLITTTLLLQAPLTVSSMNAPNSDETNESGLRWFHPEGFPSVDEWEDKLRGRKIFLGPSYHLQVPNTSVSLTMRIQTYRS